uniref:Uncharacterized protein n=1 Tax=Alexandrium monilatum TaxID=311494 RepID=A0A7S4QA49_9DINO|mmetsp:Transcript_68656/g.212338  ORF Transcript_68656/g.212338 Transcript_68656/m.212338 type:complete len:426 (+) Transcript_68656:70-1347(+)
MELSHAAAKGDWALADDAVFDELLALNGRYVHLDVTRICCIVCLTIGTFDPRHYEWNTLYAQSWILQLAWLVSGFCFCLSKRPLLSYLLRILAYFTLGAVINICTWLINDWQWEFGFWFVVHQMNFVFCLFWVLLLLAPLKRHLQGLAEGARATMETFQEKGPEEGSTRFRDFHLQGGAARGFVVLTGGLAVISLFCCLAISPALRDLCIQMSKHGINLGSSGLRTEERAGSLGKNVGVCLQTICSGFWIVLVLPRFFKNTGVVAWALLANLYMHRLVWGYGRGGFFFDGVYYVMIALTAYHLGLSRRRQLGKLVHRYWMVVFFLLRFCCAPGLHGALGLQPPEDRYDRERFILVEALFLISWLTAGQHMADPAIFADDQLGWVNMWALTAFPTVVGAKWLIPWPLSWMLLVALGPACWLCQRSG